MCHEKDLVIEENFYICPKTEYYRKELFKKKITRKKMQNKKKNQDPIMKSSATKIPTSFEHEETFHVIGKNLDLDKWCQDKEVKKLCVLDKFLIFVLQPRFRNTTFISHNGTKFGNK